MERIENIDKNKSQCYTNLDFIKGGVELKVAEICKDFISRSDKQQKEIAQMMGWTPQLLCNKLRKNNLSAEEFISLLGKLGYEIKIVSTDNRDETTPMKRGVGKRLKMMVNGVKYDTYKADAICHSDETENYFLELYKDIEGRYFVAQYVMWEGGVSSITPISEEDAQVMMGKFAQA